MSFLKRKSVALIRQLNFTQSSVEELQAMDHAELSVRLDQLDRIQEQFESTHSLLEEEDPNELDGKNRGEFAATFIRNKAAFTRELNKLDYQPMSSTRNQPPQEQPSVVIVKQPRSRLPELQLQPFDGAYTEWPNFFGMFQTVVNNDSELSNLEKFQYLRSCLRGAALDTIQSLEIRDENYITALNLLVERFDNRRLIFQAHIHELFKLQRVSADRQSGELRSLVDKVVSHVRALQSLGTTEQIADCLLQHITAQKLDATTHTLWEERVSAERLPTWTDMVTFLQRRCQTIENVAHAMVTKTPSIQVSNIKYRKTSFVVSKTAQKVCAVCNKHDHVVYSCPVFASISPNERWKTAKNTKLCINCLKPGHQVQQCKSSACRRCSLMHHTLLHFNQTDQTNLRPPEGLSSPVQSTPFVAMTASNLSPVHPNASSNECVLLATVIVLIRNYVGSLVPCRAILDSASQLNFITTRLASQLQLKKSKSLVTVSGIGDSELVINSSVNIFIQSLHSNFTAIMDAAVTPTITDCQPNHSLDITQWDIPANITLADPEFHKPQRVDLLIGASMFFDLLCIGQFHLRNSNHILQKTRFGWVVSGGRGISSRLSFYATTATNSFESHAIHQTTNDMVRSFWEVENSFEPIRKATKEEIDCEVHFKAHYSRMATGEYSVRLPLKPSVHLLGDSYQQALQRFLALERRLQRNHEVKSQYSSFMKEYLDLNHMSPISKPPSTVPVYFMPHHCVFKNDSTTTKLRVVFDGSAQTTTGYSLNEVLMTGPTIQAKLADTLIRFRSHAVALSGDICKMYRCIKIAAPDNYLQCIFWRDDPQDDIQMFKLDTVTYGTKSAPYLAVRTMHQLAADEAASYPLGSHIILRDFYVDDLITGGDTINDVNNIMQQTSEVLGKGRFKIRKWCSNVPEVLSNVPDADREKLIKFDDGSYITKTLGLQWNPDSDLFLFSFVARQANKKITKRSVLSTIAQFYDPLGLIGPIVCKAKMFLQRLWMEGLDWDESLPLSHQTTWLQLYGEFGALRQLKFPRYVSSPNASLELHAFCDASLSAYGACIYIVARLQGNVRTTLLCSKSRVAPLKTITVPKLELCAATLLAQVVNAIDKLGVFNCPFFCWSDSTTVLSWLKEEPSSFNVFVANRITTIQQSTKGMEWRHVPTSLNPADILSRGASPIQLASSSLWTNGPPFLHDSEQNWPKHSIRLENLPERRKVILLSSSSVIDASLNCKYINSFAAMQRIYGYVHMFIKMDRSGNLTTAHIQQGTWYLLRMVQRVQFFSEYKALKKTLPISSSSKLASLSPFLDSFGLIRVGGRLRNSLLNFQSRHPILLPKGHPLTTSIIMHFHHQNLHAGPQALVAAIRQQYWPVGGKKAVSHIINKCVRCFRLRPKMCEQIMGNLPEGRVRPSRPFLTTGIDYCGPFHYRSEIRGRPPTKCYICLFICFTTKAVHMELAKDLSTESFLAALRRFYSIRGKPMAIWSDNATNFVGARNEMAELRQHFLKQQHVEAVYRQCLIEGIDWKFIPPRSPHFGGLWESSIKMAKFYFWRVVGSAMLNFDQHRTLVCQISAVINSRPLCSISENPDDLDVLTPAHFLIGAPLTSIPEPNLSTLNIGRLGHWQRVQFMQQVFWKRWSSEYLSLMQQRSRWKSSTDNIAVGTLVLIKDEALPPLKWPLGRITQIFKGNDGMVRVAEVKTEGGVCKRAIAKLCPLPIDDDTVGGITCQRGENVQSAIA